MKIRQHNVSGKNGTAAADIVISLFIICWRGHTSSPRRHGYRFVCTRGGVALPTGFHGSAATRRGRPAIWSADGLSNSFGMSDCRVFASRTSCRRRRGIAFSPHHRPPRSSTTLPGYRSPVYVGTAIIDVIFVLAEQSPKTAGRVTSGRLRLAVRTIFSESTAADTWCGVEWRAGWRRWLWRLVSLAYFVANTAGWSVPTRRTHRGDGESRIGSRPTGMGG